VPKLIAPPSLAEVCSRPGDCSTGAVQVDRVYVRRCLPVCPHGLIEEQGQILSRLDWLAPLLPPPARAVSFNPLWSWRGLRQALPAWWRLPLSLRRLAVSCGLEALSASATLKCEELLGAVLPGAAPGGLRPLCSSMGGMSGDSARPPPGSAALSAACDRSLLQGPSSGREPMLTLAVFRAQARSALAPEPGRHAWPSGRCG